MPEEAKEGKSQKNFAMISRKVRGRNFAKGKGFSKLQEETKGGAKNIRRGNEGRTIYEQKQVLPIDGIRLCSVEEKVSINGEKR